MEILQVPTIEKINRMKNNLSGKPESYNSMISKKKSEKSVKFIEVLQEVINRKN